MPRKKSEKKKESLTVTIDATVLKNYKKVMSHEEENTSVTFNGISSFVEYTLKDFTRVRTEKYPKLKAELSPKKTQPDTGDDFTEGALPSLEGLDDPSLDEI